MLKDVMLLWQAHSFADLPIPIMELIAMRQKEGIKSIFPLPAAGLRSLLPELFLWPLCRVELPGDGTKQNVGLDLVPESIFSIRFVITCAQKVI